MDSFCMDFRELDAYKNILSYSSPLIIGHLKYIALWTLGKNIHGNLLDMICWNEYWKYQQYVPKAQSTV